MPGEILVTIVLLFAVIVMASVVFCAWVIASVVRITWRALAWGVTHAVPAPRRQFVNYAAPQRRLAVRCPRDKCRAENPEGARFCRRCGCTIHRVPVVAMRRAAMW